MSSFAIELPALFVDSPKKLPSDYWYLPLLGLMKCWHNSVLHILGVLS